ncbi:hypothetical protein Tco_0199383 [Tanacetum coccineum]
MSHKINCVYPISVLISGMQTRSFDFVNPQCPNERKILANILNNHPLRFCVAASAFILLFPLQASPNTLIPYPKFTKIIVDHYMTEHPDISRRVDDKYHKVENDGLVKNIFNSRKNKKGAGMKIPEWMLTDEMKLIDHYRMTTSAPRTPNPEVTEGESSAQRKPMMIRFRVPLRRQIITAKIKNVEIAEESVGDEFELRRREKGKGIEETRDTHPPTPIRSPRTHIASISLDKETLQELTVTTEDAHSFADKEKLQELTVTDSTHSSSSPTNTGRFKRYKSFIQQIGGRYGYMFGHLKKHFMPRKKFHQLAKHLHSTMAEFLPSMVGERVKEIAQKIKERENLRAEVTLQVNNAIANSIPPQYLMIKDNEKLRNLSIWWSLKIKFDKLALVVAPCRTAAIRLRDHDDHQYDAHLKGENSAKRQKMLHRNLFYSWRIFILRNNIWNKKKEPKSIKLEVSQELLEEMSGEIDKAQLQKAIDKESRKERLSLPTPNKPSPVYHSCQRDPKAPPMTLLNQDLFYLKYGNSRSKKYTLSLHKYPAVSFPDDDIEE